MANNPFEYVINAVQPAVDMIAAELVDVLFKDGTQVNQIKAIPPKDVSETSDETGLVIVEFIVRKFTIAKADLTREPEVDMVINWRGDSYRAAHPAGQKVWEWQDHYQQRYEITTEKMPVPVEKVALGNLDGIAYGNDDPEGTAYGGASN